MEAFFKISPKTSKIEKYKEAFKQVKSLVENEKNLLSDLANTCSILKIYFNNEFSWVGFYLLSPNKKQLTLGPFQGKPACTRIKVGKGVCGQAVKLRKTLVVPDVSKFPGHIYCDPDSKSEIVIPMIKRGSVIGVLDIDSHKYETFDEIDRFYLEKIVEMILYQIKN